MKPVKKYWIMICHVVSGWSWKPCEGFPGKTPIDRKNLRTGILTFQLIKQRQG